MRKTTTALARRKPAPTAKRASARQAKASVTRIPPLAVSVPAGRALSDEIQIDALGLVELKLTAREEEILNEPVPMNDLLVKPNGQVYLSHIGYTRWFNRAFGRMGWALVQASKPMREGTTVTVPYVLYVHTKPVAFAVGEMEYHPTNREQTYGDVIEGTVGSALRRCAKRLGISLDLWDKVFISDFLRERCVRVRCTVTDRDSGAKSVKYQWRRRVDPPFYNEVEEQPPAAPRQPVSAPVAPRQPVSAPVAPRQPVSAPAPKPAASAPAPGGGGRVISEPQRQRFWAIANTCGRRESEIKLWLAQAHGIESTRDIPSAKYDALVAALQQPGPLVAGLGDDGEPA